MSGATTIDQSGNATTRYLHYDHLGSVDTITDDQGNVAQAMSFDAFGQRRDAATRRTRWFARSCNFTRPATKPLTRRSR